MRLRSVDCAYGWGDAVRVYSAYQRQEIVESTVDNNLITNIEVIGHWTDYDKSRAEVKAFNRKQHENSRNG